MKQKLIKCPYCGAYAYCRPASVVYGETKTARGAYLYICSRWPSCDAYVGVHRKSRRPLGTLANGDLRHKRILAHKALKRLQKHCHMEKWEAYLWLQANLGLPGEETHIGMFSEYRCNEVISLCREAIQHADRQAA